MGKPLPGHREGHNAPPMAKAIFPKILPKPSKVTKVTHQPALVLADAALVQPI